eukprot:gene3294-28039_t
MIGVSMLFAVAIIAVTPAPPAPPASPAPPLPLANSTSVVFDSRHTPKGARANVTCYRIPSIEQTPDGTLVAFTEARIGKFTPDGKDLLVPSCDDCVVNGIAQRRSTDGGRSWGEYTWAVSDQSTDPSRNNMDVGGNPSVLFNTVTNKLVLQFVRGMLYKKTEAQSCNPATTNWQQESSDAGLTWPWAGSLVGPSNGIQLTHNADHKGRLVWCGHWGVYNSTEVWYSDDNGVTYTLSATVFERMDECTLAELNDGRVYLNMRNKHSLKFKNSTSCECRGVATSEDGGATFGKLRMDPALPSPVCQATLSSAGGSLLFANPASKQSRTQGEIKKSTDMGETWSSTLHVTHPGATIDQGGSYDYSCLVPTAMKDDPTKGGLLWSHRSNDGRCNTNPAPKGCWLALFSRFPLDF